MLSGNREIFQDVTLKLIWQFLDLPSSILGVVSVAYIHGPRFYKIKLINKIKLDPRLRIAPLEIDEAKGIAIFRQTSQ